MKALVLLLSFLLLTSSVTAGWGIKGLVEREHICLDFCNSKGVLHLIAALGLLANGAIHESKAMWQCK